MGGCCVLTLTPKVCCASHGLRALSIPGPSGPWSGEEPRVRKLTSFRPRLCPLVLYFKRKRIGERKIGNLRLLNITYGTLPEALES